MRETSARRAPARRPGGPAWVSLWFAALGSLAVTSGLRAQGTTGKVEGAVMDPDGRPVAGAQVMLRGTALGTVTSMSGYYFLNNVPAGVYTVFAAFVGFQPTEVRGVRVLADQTLTVDLRLERPVELGAITIAVEQNPIVPRDQVTTKSIVTGAMIAGLPVDDVQDIVNLQPGVVASTRGLSLRGGRVGEAAVYVDGALVRSHVWGSAPLALGTNALEEVSVTTGAIGVEYGDAQSGVIAFVTRAGGPRLAGAILYETDEVVGSGRIGFNRLEASVGGPVTGPLTFFVAATLDGRQSDLMGRGFAAVPTYVLGGIDTTVTEAVTKSGPGARLDTIQTRAVTIPRFLQYGGECEGADNGGYPCQGARRPYNWNTLGTALLKLQLTYGGGSRLSGTYLLSRDQGREWDHRTAFAPQLTRGHRLDSRLFVLNWTHQAFRADERALSFDISLSHQTDREVRGPLTPDAVTGRRHPFGGWSLAPLSFVVDFDHFSDDTPAMYGGVESLVVTRLQTDRDWDQLVYNMRTGQGTRVPYLDREDLRNTQEFRMNPWAQATGFHLSGLETRVRLMHENRSIGRGYLDWQVDRYSRVRVGGEAQVSRVRLVDAATLRLDLHETFSERPIQYALFAEERLDIGDLVIELGGRWDYFNTGAYFSSPFPWQHPRLVRENPLDPARGVFVRATGHARLSPRLRVSFPVTDRTGLRLSYAHQVQTPDLFTSLRFLNTWGWAADVGFGRTVLFEFGIRHALTPDLVVDLSAFNKEKAADLTTRRVLSTDAATGRAGYGTRVTNADFGNVRGVDVGVVRRVAEIVHAQLAYTFQVAKGTGSDPWSSISSSLGGLSSATGLEFEPPQAIFTTDDNRVHTITGALAVNTPAGYAPDRWYGHALRNVGVFLRWRFASGLPYTPLTNDGAGDLAPYMGVIEQAGVTEGAINSARMPWTRELDLRVTKGVRVGAMDWTVYADVRNLLDFRNLQRLFAETDGPVNARHRVISVAPEVVRLEQEAGAFFSQRPDGSVVIDLPADCGRWGGGPTNCVLLKRAEARFGNGDGAYTEPEYRAAFNAAYDQQYGTFFFYEPPRHTRVGVELRF